MCTDQSPIAAALLEIAQIRDCASLSRDRCSIPASPGAYALWCDAAAFAALGAALPLDASGHEREGRRLLYVGIAPRRPVGDAPLGSGNLKKRLSAHLHGPVRYSTLRRSLASVLQERLGLVLARNCAGKLLMAGDCETTLSAWIAASLSVSWVETPEPWLAEEAILSGPHAPPLNIAGAGHVQSSGAIEQLRGMRRRAGLPR
jgi:hypothetical protein